MSIVRNITQPFLSGIVKGFVLEDLLIPALPATPDLYSAITDGSSLGDNQFYGNDDLDGEGKETIDKRAAGYPTQILAQSFQIFDLPFENVFAVSGRNAADIKANISSPVDFINNNSTDAVFLDLGVNDVKLTRSIQDIKDDYNFILNAYQQSAIRYVYLLMPQPRGDIQNGFDGNDQSDEDNFVQRLHDLRLAIAEEAAKFSKVRLYDAWDDIIDDSQPVNATTGLRFLAKEGYLDPQDRLHFSQSGAYYVGLRGFEAIKSTPLWSDPQNAVDISNSITANAGMIGVGGSLGTGASGVVADTLRVRRNTGSNMVAVCSKDTAVIFGQSQDVQRVQFSGAVNGLNSGGEEFYVEYQIDTSSAGGLRFIDFNGNEAVQLFTTIKIPSHKGLISAYAYCRIGDVDGDNIISGDLVPVTGVGVFPEDEPLEYLLKTEPIKIDAGTSVRAQIVLRVSLSGDVAGNRADVLIGSSPVNRVNLTL